MAQRESVRDFLTSRPAPSVRYRVEVLVEPKPGPNGMAYRVGAERRVLPWRLVERVLVAEVGEPE
ncbi:MAG TPA: hypothetical protein VM285_09050, partial [Polyangia bacterium]|nr:hypothetical protein [Polyangia bacterium]